MQLPKVNAEVCSAIESAAEPCPLCHHQTTHNYHSDKRRSYWLCPVCHLVFAGRASLLDAAAELAIYQQHQNDPADAGYRDFLNKLAAPLLQRLGASAQQGLDFGAGPGPTLYLLLQQGGHDVANYDPYFAPNHTLLQRQYDFLCSTEAIEHFYQPAKEWQLWLELLKPGGWLGLMTRIRPDSVEEFGRWHYKNDPTHVSFFHATTFQWLAARDGFSLEIIAPDVVLMQLRCSIA